MPDSSFPYATSEFKKRPGNRWVHGKGLHHVRTLLNYHCFEQLRVIDLLLRTNDAPFNQPMEFCAHDVCSDVSFASILHGRDTGILSAISETLNGQEDAQKSYEGHLPYSAFVTHLVHLKGGEVPLDEATINVSVPPLPPPLEFSGFQLLGDVLSFRCYRLWGFNALKWKGVTVIWVLCLTRTAFTEQWR